MKNSTLKRMSEILQNSAITRIVQQANELNLLNDRVRRLLPDLYDGFYRVVNLSGNQLIFDVPSAVIRQGFLLQQATLLALIQRDFPQVTELKFQVNPQLKRI